MAPLLHRWRLQALGLVLALLLPGAAVGAEVLRVVTWPGYADPDLVKVFEQRTGAKVEVTFIDSDDTLWQRINNNQAQDFDVFAVNTAELQRYISGGLVVPIDTAQVPNLAKQLPRFRNPSGIPGIAKGDKVYAVPYTFSEMGLIYDRQQVKEAPVSIKALWDPRYRGKVLLYDGASHNFTLAAQSLGDSNPFQIAEQEWPAAVNRLIELRRNAMGFYSQPEESVDLFKRKQAALLFANYGSQQLQLLRAAGVDVGYAIPQEGALAWLDCWVITRGAKNKNLATAWIDYFLEAEPSNALVKRQGLANTVAAAPNMRSQDRVKWLEPVESAPRRSLLWERILAGDRASKVLAP